MPQHDVVASCYARAQALRDCRGTPRCRSPHPCGRGPSHYSSQTEWWPDTTAVNLHLGILALERATRNCACSCNDPNNRASRQRLGSMLTDRRCATNAARKGARRTVPQATIPTRLDTQPSSLTTPDEIKRATSRSRIAAVTTLERATRSSHCQTSPAFGKGQLSSTCGDTCASRSEPVVRQLQAPEPRLARSRSYLHDARRGLPDIDPIRPPQHRAR